MKISRRQALAGLASAPAILSFGRSGWAQPATTTLKISHQFPGGTLEQGDFRDRLCRIFAREVEKRTGGGLKFEVYANSSLMKTNAQFSAMRKGALDMSLYPIAYAGGELHACNLGLMPCLVTSYEQGARWKTAPIGKAFSKIVEDKGVKFIAWIWQAGGVASRRTPIIAPADVKGLTIRGGSRETDMMFAAAGAKVSTMPSNEIYIGMQTSALDAAVTSSTSLISFRLEELAKSLTAARKGSFWFMLEPLLMSKAIFDTLPPAQQQALLEVGAEMEAWGMAEARKDDDQVAAVYGAKGCQVADFGAEHLAQWRKIAEESAWSDYAAKSAEAAELLRLARDVT
ncbi:TRAP transporter substrate-binding protein DctP [Magnetospirillum sp. 15-1]|uniref:TRAP transporter substrate-binding protein DctP n=1 Tax=Magnetospirillum sp. 15-1 TaxID=1979370 RepID=UPI000BBC514A|nr:TRAP transporter substrate-binding protein DctP [Magnetospirillum sp. 15-1]